LSSPSLIGGLLLLLTHYPVLDVDGIDYHRSHPLHSVDNNNKLIEIIKQQLIPAIQDNQTAAMILHGHVHRGYQTDFNRKQLVDDSLLFSLPSYNPGSSGKATNQRGQHPSSAAYNLYTIQHINKAETDGENKEGQQSSRSTTSNVHIINGWRIAVDRYVHDGDQFRLEAVPYSSTTNQTRQQS